MLTQEQKDETLAKIVEKCKENNFTLLYAVITGSVAYGNYVEGKSDLDARFLYVADKEFYLGFGGKDFVDVSNNDISGMELVKFIKLALSGNPSVLEILHSAESEIIYLIPEFKKILNIKDEFLAKSVYPSFIKYAENQMRKAKSCTKEVVDSLVEFESALTFCGISLQNLSVKESVRSKRLSDASDTLVYGDKTVGSLIDEYKSFKQKYFPYSDLGKKRRDYVVETGFDAKNCSHAIRLSRTCKEMLEGKGLLVRRPDASYLLDIKSGKYSLEEIDKEFQLIKSEVDILLKVSKLQEEPNTSLIRTVTIDLVSEIVFNK